MSEAKKWKINFSEWNFGIEEKQTLREIVEGSAQIVIDELAKEECVITITQDADGKMKANIAFGPFEFVGPLEKYDAEDEPDEPPEDNWSGFIKPDRIVGGDW